MSSEILLRFLQNGLIDVGGDDAKLKKLQETADAVSDALQKNPAKTTAFALTAFDPDITAEQPVVQEVAAALAKQWPTYVNTFAGTPTTALRAILLSALATAANKDDRIAAALAAYARNMLPHIRVGNEQPIWGELVVGLDDQVEKRAEAEWSTPDVIEVLPLELSINPTKIPIKALQIDRKALEENLLDASGPSRPSGEQGQDSNPYWSNSAQNWSHEFAPRAARAIAGVVDPALKVTIGAVDLGDPLKKAAEAVDRHLYKTLEAVSHATGGLKRRTHLLWWKEALYSPSLRCSYRDMPGLQAAVLMAFDLYNQIPDFTPLSVSAFLGENRTELAANRCCGTKPFT